MKEPKKKEEKVGAPGSFALAIIFLLWFILMYVVNYRLLSQAWPVK